MQTSELQQALQQRQQQQLLRQPVTIQQYQGRIIHIENNAYLNFSANDYLGLASAPEIKQALTIAAKEYGSGSSGSPLVTGQHQVHQQLTETLADWLGFERVLLFSSGFAANQAMLTTLSSKQDTLLLDKLCHASLIDAALHSTASFQRFAHNDLAALRQKLQKTQNAMVVTEGVFSMDGDSPDLASMAQLCQQYQAALLLDDAHGLGVNGNNGKGSWQQQGLKPEQLFCYMANFGKAFGGQGAFLAGSKTVIDYLEQFARHYVFSTALSPVLCKALITSIRLVQQDWRREKLQQNIALFRQLTKDSDLNLLASDSPIQGVIVGSAELALLFSKILQQKNIWLTAIRPPTVPVNTARLRITLSCLHTEADIRYLVEQLKAVQQA